jgi:flagella synthesis protein FlgN
MSREAPVKRVLLGIQADLADYRELRDLQEAQFEASLRHDSTALTDIAANISMLCVVLDARLRERIELLENDPGFSEGLSLQTRMTVLLEGLPVAVRTLAVSVWNELEALVRECKALNARNCALIMEQHAIMQRVLGHEAGIYAPR